MILYLIIITGVCSMVAFSSSEALSKMIFNPYRVEHNREWWRFITSGFIHADWMHLMVNMFVFYSFGQTTLDNYSNAYEGNGEYYFLILYFGGMIVANISSYKKNRDNPEYNALGASGAVSAVVFAFIVFKPLTMLYLFGIIPIPGIVFGVLYLIYSLYEAKRAADFINHEAHFWGAVFGFLFTIVMKPELFNGFIYSVTHFLK
ncbi:MAG: rhomboid family intramembrane serine protease [Bacteroidia bacterium]|nr:rhomboid family intramembrane serine protease [Bacteroidia bacterium]